MSRLGYLLLSMCDHDLVVDLHEVANVYPYTSAEKIRWVAKMLGLKVKK